MPRQQEFIYLTIQFSMERKTSQYICAYSVVFPLDQPLRNKWISFIATNMEGILRDLHLHIPMFSGQ